VLGVGGDVTGVFCGGVPLGPLGFECCQYRQTLRPTVDGAHALHWGSGLSVEGVVAGAHAARSPALSELGCVFS
jgi:hypothetical protein